MKMHRDRYFDILGHDNETSFITDDVELAVCPGCLLPRDKWSLPLQGKRIRKRTLDISSTYDGFRVASQRFVEEYRKHNLVGLQFLVLPDDPQFAVVYPTHVVPLDVEQTHLEFEDRCPVCGEWDTIVLSGNPICLKSPVSVSPEGFARTDYELATHEEKSPILICGQLAMEVLRSSNLKGLVIGEVSVASNGVDNP